MCHSGSYVTAQHHDIVRLTVKLNISLGAGICYLSSDHPILPNNGLILVNGQVNEFHCISGSTISNVGHLFDINEVNITTSNSDPFFTFHHTPGTLLVKSLRWLHSNEQGIYTCRTPDETGSIVDVNVGLYHYGSVCKQLINMLAITFKHYSI